MLAGGDGSRLPGGYLRIFADDPCLKEFPVRFMKPFQFIVFPSKGFITVNGCKPTKLHLLKKTDSPSREL